MFIVGIHEAGHFTTAKLFAVKVYEFGLGIPPKMLRVFRDKSGTDYTFNWLPLGWFVRLKWEAFDDSIKDDKDALFNRPMYQQMIIVLAGVIMNFIGAVVLFSIVFMIGSRPVFIHIQDSNQQGILSKLEFESILIPQFENSEEAIEKWAIERRPGILMTPLPDSVAMEAGILPGDMLVRIDGQQIVEVPDVVDIFQASSPGDSFELHLVRDNAPVILDITPVDKKIWSYLQANITVPEIQYGFLESIKYGVVETKNQTFLTINLLGYMARTWFTSDDEEAKKEVAQWVGGPIAIGNVFVDMTKNGVPLANVLIFAALISISLAIFNLLPFPALDGGRFLVMLVNSISRALFKKDLVSLHLEAYIHAAGFILLIGLALLVAYNDVLKIFN